MKGFLIAGTASGVGKTTVALAIVSAMRRRGLIVQPFKGGPDFLDTGHHTRISGRSARNIDSWMLSADSNIDLVRKACHGADVAIVEGMMGLFDGKDGASEAGSSAEIAKLFKLPVILVVDAGKSARSIAAVVLGFESFDTQLSLAGIILNRVAGERHHRMLAKAIASACKTPILGWLSHEAAITIPERHLGLHTAEEIDAQVNVDELIETLGNIAEKHLDLDRILSFECGLDLEPRPLLTQLVGKNHIRLGVAHDRAFCFYYEDNLDLLREQGAEIILFSPIDNFSLPEGIDALYLGGGYPELYAQALSANTAMLTSIRKFVESGRPVYAECGGMIYLSRQLIMADNVTHRMAGIFPFTIEMTNKLVQFGYVTIELTRDCLIGSRGATIRGHSFHYSRITNLSGIRTSYRIQYSLSDRQEEEGYTAGNVLASYIHLHFGANPSVAEHFVETAHRISRAQITPEDTGETIAILS